MDDRQNPRLYLTTPPETDIGRMATLVGAALATGEVACLRLDLGPADQDLWRRAADALRPVCHEADIALVVSDHFRLVEPLGLDGVHLAASRTPLREVRKVLGRERIVGAFAGASKHLGMSLAEAGADYVSFGPVRETGALGDDRLATPELFEWWAEMIEVPVVAEGGVSPADAARLAPFADFLVPDAGVWSAPGGIAAALAPYAAALEA